MSENTRRRRPKAPTKCFVKSPTNHTGNKVRLLHRLLPEFGNLRDRRFVDLFAGGMSVGLNVDAARVLFVDAHPEVAALAKLFSAASPGQVESGMADLISRYGFSDTVAHGYEAYGTNSSVGVAAHNRDPHLRLRDDFNHHRLETELHDIARFALVVFGYNNQIRVRLGDGHWMNPPGKRDFNTNSRANLAATVQRLTGIDHEVLHADFRDVSTDLTTDDFVYLDPPYLLGAATYNRTWTESDDRDVLDLMDSLSERGIPWAMSNVLTHKGEEHTTLQCWLRARGHEVQHLDFDYLNPSARGNRGHLPTDEVLILSPNSATARLAA